jgi:hypothetical protein
MSGMEALTEGWFDWQAALPFVDLDGAVAVKIVAGWESNCALLVKGVVRSRAASGCGSP